jgi:exopolysaccharide production protein ExoY
VTIHLGRSEFLLPARTALQEPLVPTQRSFYAVHGKRALDLVLVIASAPIWVLLVGLLAILVALSGGQPFYSQSRVGRNGHVFKLWKLRSMVPESEAILRYHLDADSTMRAEWDRTQKIANDPRVTRLGAILRRTSLDELPQLWNVVKGDMSLVGPRPMLPEQCHLYPGKSYYSLRPGITGLWQISGRGRSAFAARSKYDHNYVRAISLSRDLKILAATIAVVFHCTGN